MKSDALYLRKAQFSDLDLLFNWVNEAEVRKSAFNSEPIRYEDHMNWFKRMMGNSDEIQYILMLKEKPIGQIRLSIDGDQAEIDYSISKEVRGNGYGKEILELIKQETEAEFSFVKKLIAKVKPSNTSSLYCFKENGFVEKYRQLEYIRAGCN